MRLSNRNKTPFYSFIYSLAGIILILWLIAFILEINKFDVLGDKSWVLLFIPTVMLLFLYLSGRPIFEYDSDGEALNFRNCHILFLLSQNNAKDEFPKYKLIKYNVVNVLIFSTLYVYVSSKKSNVVILKYDLTFMTKKEIKDLKFSLNKVVKTNGETSKDDNTVID